MTDAEPTPPASDAAFLAWWRLHHGNDPEAARWQWLARAAWEAAREGK